MKRWMLLGLLLVCGGCASVDQLADTLEKRHVTSCLTLRGIAPPYVTISGIVATGGATLAECRGDPPPVPARRYEEDVCPCE